MPGFRSGPVAQIPCTAGHVHAYCITGHDDDDTAADLADDRAQKMIEMFDNLIPVEAKAFAQDDIGAAWACVGTIPSVQAAAVA